MSALSQLMAFSFSGRFRVRIAIPSDALHRTVVDNGHSFRAGNIDNFGPLSAGDKRLRWAFR